MIACNLKCQTQFNPENDPQKCKNVANYVVPDTCEYCAKQCLTAGLDPQAMCFIDCGAQHNPEQDENKCLVTTGPCYKCMQGCNQEATGSTQQGQEAEMIACSLKCHTQFNPENDPQKCNNMANMDVPDTCWLAAVSLICFCV